MPCHADVDDSASNVHCARTVEGQLRMQNELKNLTMYIHNVQSPEWKAIYVVEGMLFVSSRNVEEEVPETNQDHEEENKKPDRTGCTGLHVVLVLSKGGEGGAL